MDAENPVIQEEICQNGLIFCLNKEEYTAFVTGNDNSIVNAIIPSSIIHEKQEFIVTCIKEGSFANSRRIKSVKLPIDSKVQIVEKDSFVNSTIEEILISNSVTELKEGWCKGTPMLTKIAIASKNENFIYLDNKMILGKTDTKCDKYDVIIFARRDIKNVLIPSFIKIIALYAFSDSQIETISIPVNLTKICEGAFYNCKHLQKVQFPANSDIQMIEKNSFSKCSIEYISLPSSFVEIYDDNLFNKTTKIDIISDDQNFDDFETIEEIQTENEENSIFVIENKNTKEKYVKKIFKTNIEKSEKEYFNKIIKIQQISKFPGILSIVYFTNKPFPTIITEYRSNGKLSIYFAKNSFSETQKFIIIYGILKSVEFLSFHDLYLKEFSSDKIYIDDNFYPTISITELITKENDDNISYSNQSRIKIIAYSLFNGCNFLEQTHIEWQNKFLKQFMPFCKALNSTNIKLLCSLQKENAELNEDEEINKYESIINDYLINLFKDIQKNYQSNIYSTYLYAKMLNKGYMIEENKEEALKLYKIASEHGHAKSSKMCSLLCDSTSDIIYYTKLAADQGDIKSIFKHALQLSWGYGIEINKVEAAKYYKLAADKGKVSAMRLYALMLFKKDGIEENDEEAFKYFERAANEDDKISIFYVGLMFYLGRGVKLNKKIAAKYFKIAADKGQTESMYNYATMLYRGEGIEINQIEAIKYYKLAADNGYVNAIYNYALRLFKGDVIEENKEEAAKYFKLAADKDDTESMVLYAKMLYNGEGIETNKKEAAKYFKLAADKDDTESMYNYAKMVYRGEEVDINKEEAIKYFKLASDKKHPGSMFYYSQMLSQGDGIEKNEEEAAKYMKLAADNDHFESVFTYATMLSEGNGIKMDKKESEKYFNIAENTNYLKYMINHTYHICSEVKKKKIVEEAIEFSNHE